MAKRYRDFAFTFNNWQDKDWEYLKSVDCRYIVWGEEVGKSGTPHLQGHIVFAEAKSVSSVRKKLPGCNVDFAKAPEKSILYCKKGEQPHEEWTDQGVDGPNYGKNAKVTERGDKPDYSLKSRQAKGNDSEQAKWKNIRMSAERGELDNIPEKIRFLHPHLLEHHRQLGKRKRRLPTLDEFENYWFFGTPGSGKSKTAREKYPDAYLKMCNKWWCDYDDEEVVLIEDFDKRHDVLAYHMKIWSDRYPFRAEVKKGNTGVIRPKKIIVTSNYHPSDIWTSPEDLKAIMRRFKVVEFGTAVYPGKRIKLEDFGNDKPDWWPNRNYPSA